MKEMLLDPETLKREDLWGKTVFITGGVSDSSKSADDVVVPIPSPPILPLSQNASNGNGDHRWLAKSSTAPLPRRSSTRVHLLAKFATQVYMEQDTNTLARSKSDRNGLSRLATFLAIGQDNEDSSDEESDEEDKFVDFLLTKIKLVDNNVPFP
ncbi:hypothetical protein M427DRAFT_33261 [Gonapodya prolifera JEL478]|uniref:Uncharacterized protein n=1 Tax=Gonapodya prolifera (strain JEL478) TaxID=1344416 RepID=A0A139AC75_GONPJ|nr:hypothetical protein M427DRAFT_33261 [Gonapodya prolifera JEL478]|eukprot:KXS14338.1 hypothetical protein M427DRAFT_33261 [Gonapodya prolifera JEL478]